MANEIYHRSNWGNAVNDIAWGDVYEKFDATNEMFVRSDNYENSNETDKLMAAINPKPSILLTPTAYDNGSLHSVEPVLSPFADFDFSRGTIATRVNEQGLIEDVTDTNLPRIDYTDGTGSLLLEPQSTNTATYSNDFTQGDVFNGSGNPGVDEGVLTSQQSTSPDGTNNAWLLKDDNSGGTGQPNTRFFGVSVNSNDFNTVSVFAKKALNNNFIILTSAGFDNTSSSWFNISNGTLGTIDSNHTAKIEDYGSGWYRCQITFKTTTDTTGTKN
jgi:hypothetical protein